MFSVDYGKIKEGKAKSFQDWHLKDENIQKLKEALPMGAKYLGTYIIANGADYDFEIWYEMDNWAVLDTWREHQKWEEFVTDFIKEIGPIFEDIKTKFLRTIRDAKFFG